MPKPIERGQRYMPGLDGLRAVAVLAVPARPPLVAGDRGAVLPRLALRVAARPALHPRAPGPRPRPPAAGRRDAGAGRRLGRADGPALSPGLRLVAGLRRHRYTGLRP